MTTQEILNEIRNIVAKHKGSTKELYEVLLGEAEGWKMYLEEIGDDEE